MNNNDIRDYVYLTFTGNKYSDLEANRDYDSIVSLLSDIYSNDAIISSIINDRSIDSASSNGLDVIGKKFGVNRTKFNRHTSLSDDNVIVGISNTIDKATLFKDITKPIIIPKEAIINISDIYSNTYRPLTNVIISNTTFSGAIYLVMNNEYNYPVYPASITSIEINPLLISNINLNVYNSNIFTINNTYVLSIQTNEMNDTEYRYVLNTKIQSLLIKNNDFIIGELNRIANVVDVHKFENLYGLGSTTYYIETTNKSYDDIIKPIANAILENYSTGNCNICFPTYLELTIYTTDTDNEAIKSTIENTPMGERVDLSKWHITNILINNIQAIDNTYLIPMWNEKYVVSEIINV